MEPSVPQHDQAPPPKSRWARFLDFMELSSPEGRGGLWITLGLLVFCFWPLVLLGVLDVSGTRRKLLIALGPAAICLGFAVLILFCGYRYGASLKWSRAQTWGLAALFLGMGLASGAGLWFSEG